MVMKTMHDPASLRKLTTLFPVFLGLRLVPVGLWFASLALPLPGTVPHPLHLVLLIAAAAAVWWIHGWYRRGFGMVEADRQRFGRSWALAGGLAAAYLALAAGTGRLETHNLVLMLVVILFAAAAGWALPRFLDGLRLVGAIALVALAAATLLVALPSEPERLGAAGWLFSLALGLVLCAAGWAEHQALTAALPPGPSGEAGADA